MKTRVIFASDWTSSDGETYKRGETAEIDAADARSLIFRGRVRAATESEETLDPVPGLTEAPVVDPGPALDAPVDGPPVAAPIPDAARRRPRADNAPAAAGAVPATPSETKEA